MEKKCVVVGMPVYNGGTYIEAALKSALNQTYSNLRVIVSDNASTDGTEETCRAIAAGDSRVEYIRQDENLGPVENFMFLKGKADSEYFVWLACDDCWAPDFLEKSVDLLERDPNCCLVFCDYFVKNLETGDQLEYFACASNSSSAFSRCLIRIVDMCPSAVYGVQRMAHLERVSFCRFDFADLHYLMEASIIGKVRIINQPLYTAGTRGNRIPYSITGSKIQGGRFILEEWRLFSESFSFFQASLLTLFVFLKILRRKYRS